MQQLQDWKRSRAHSSNVSQDIWAEFGRVLQPRQGAGDEAERDLLWHLSGSIAAARSGHTRNANPTQLETNSAVWPCLML
jgi:hypothetical protein